jgi:transketolase
MPMRIALSAGLVEAAKRDPRVVLLTGDHGYALFDDFRRECLTQYFNAGIAEQNMIGVAAGLAKGGFRPIVYGLSAFVPMRVLEQIKLDVCYEQLPIVMLGDGAGFVYGKLGSSHQSTEDLAALRALPNLNILSPCDAAEMTACMRMAFEAEAPVYLRVGKSDAGAVHASPPNVRWGQLCSVVSGEGPVAWIATGSMVPAAVRCAEQWPGSSVWSAPSIKPLDEELIAAVCRTHDAVVVLEEHSTYGGLASAVAEIACELAPTPVCAVGVQDRFSKACGGYDYLRQEHGLDDPSILNRVATFLRHHGVTPTEEFAPRRLAA